MLLYGKLQQVYLESKYIGYTAQICDKWCEKKAESKNNSISLHREKNVWANHYACSVLITIVKPIVRLTNQ